MGVGRRLGTIRPATAKKIPARSAWRPIARAGKASGFLVVLLPLLDVLVGDAAAALAFAVVLELAGGGFCLAAADALAIVLAGAIVHRRRFLGGRDFAGGRVRRAVVP